MAEVLSGPATSAAVRDAAEEWTEECTSLLDNVRETQGEIASLLDSTRGADVELQTMKAACDTELSELKEDAWRLQMQMELQRMAGQLEALGQPAGEEEEEGPPAAAQDMAHLDAEIALLDRELAAARIELQGLLMQQGVAATGQHLAPSE